jgi:hypothetical protein
MVMALKHELDERKPYEGKDPPPLAPARPKMKNPSFGNY